MNIEKTKAVWLGSKRFSKDILLLEKHLAWVFNEPFDLLGITFFVETQQIVEYNYRIKLDEVRKLLDSSSWRLLSIIGKIQVIKSLAVSKFVHLLTTLPTLDLPQVDLMNFRVEYVTPRSDRASDEVARGPAGTE